MEIIYTAEANGFIGRGRTPREAGIALDYACAFLPLGETDRWNKTADFWNLPGWEGKEELCHQALVGKPV